MKALLTKVVYRFVLATVPVLVLLAATALDPAPASAAKDAAKDGGARQVINVNTATESQLTLLPRVGPALAKRIVEFRNENGELKKPEDLILVRGIGDKTFDLMAPYVVISGETTLTTKLRVSDLQASKTKSDD